MARDENPDVGHIDVNYVARLARLHLTGEEAADLQGQMEEIVGFIRKIEELDLSGIEPTSHPRPSENVFRSDVARESLDRDCVMDNAPEQASGQFVVPKIVE